MPNVDIVERDRHVRFVPKADIRPAIRLPRQQWRSALGKDAADIAWKLALVVRGAARPSLLDSYAAERGIADRHALEVSDEVHNLCHESHRDVQPRRADRAAAGSGQRHMATARRLSMLDISYAGSALVGQAGAAVDGLSPGTRFPAPHNLRGTRHHLITSEGAPRLDYFRARWDKLVSVVDPSTAPFDATAAGVPKGGAILVRPDCFVGFRANPTDEMTMDALDAHLASYLIPNLGATYPLAVTAADAR